MNLQRCSAQIFRPAEPNLFCLLEAGHPPPCRFPGNVQPERESETVVLPEPTLESKQINPKGHE
jgi:hypothetical protein